MTLSCSPTDPDQADNARSEPSQFRLAFAVTDFSIGPNRLAFGMIESGIGPIKNKSLIVKTYYLEGASPEDPVETLIPVYRSWPTGQAIYTATVQFDREGRWGILAKNTA